MELTDQQIGNLKNVAVLVCTSAKFLDEKEMNRLDRQGKKETIAAMVENLNRAYKIMSEVLNITGKGLGG
jgi:hypothetical protein